VIVGPSRVFPFPEHDETTISATAKAAAKAQERSLLDLPARLSSDLLRVIRFP